MTTPGAPDGKDSPPEDTPTPVWVVEDNDLFRETLASLIEDEDDLTCPLAAATCEQALEKLRDGALPEIVLMDIGLPGMSGIEGTRRIRELSPETRVLMLTVHDEQSTVFEAILAGASGYLLKDLPEPRVLEAIRQVLGGGAPLNAHIARKILDRVEALEPPGDYGLTPRETEILELFVDGMTLAEAADKLFVTRHTVDSHVRNIYAKLHVHTRGAAIAKAIKEGLV